MFKNNLLKFVENNRVFVYFGSDIVNDYDVESFIASKGSVVYKAGKGSVYIAFHWIQRDEGLRYIVLWDSLIWQFKQWSVCNIEYSD